jgi:hypothetical protein
MSADSSTLDPYRSPTLPEGPYAGKQTTGKPGWLTALCVICIVLGALGLINAILGTAAELAGPYFQAMLSPRGGPGIPADMQQAQQDLMDEMNVIKQKYFILSLALLGFRFVAAGLLLYGGLRCLGLSEAGRKLLIAACAVALVFELSQTIIQSLVYLQNLTAMNSAMERFQSSLSNGSAPPGLQAVMKWTMRISMILPIILAYGMALLKGGVFLFGLSYLRREHIKVLFK